MSQLVAQAPPAQQGGRLKAPAQPAKAAPAKAAKTALPVWSCEFQPATVPNAGQLDNLTVGSIFQLNCHGDIDVPWQNDPVGLKFPEEGQYYSLYLLKGLKLDSREAQFLVTGYKPGEHNPEYVQVV